MNESEIMQAFSIYLGLNPCSLAKSWKGYCLFIYIPLRCSLKSVGTYSHHARARQGIAIQGGENVVIVGNVLEENREDGIEVHSLDRFVISGNLITGADDVNDMTNCGIHVETISSIGVITGNVIELVNGIGVYVQEGAYITITGNTLRKIAKHGIKAGNESNDNGRDCTIVGNTIISADYGDTETYSGIAVVGDRHLIQGNRIDDADKYGIHIAASADRTLCIGNHVYQYTGTCVQALLDEGTNSEVAHNITV